MKSSVKPDFNNSPRTTEYRWAGLHRVSSWEAGRWEGKRDNWLAPGPHTPRPPGDISSKNRGPNRAGALKPGAGTAGKLSASSHCLSEEDGRCPRGPREGWWVSPGRRAVQQTLHSERQVPHSWGRVLGVAIPWSRRGSPEGQEGGPSRASAQQQTQHLKAGPPAPWKACAAWSSERRMPGSFMRWGGHPGRHAPSTDQGSPSPTLGRNRNATLPHSIREKRRCNWTDQ